MIAGCRAKEETQGVPSLFTAATARASLSDLGRDPAEDRLTEIFAAVLDRAPGLAKALVRDWIGEDNDVKPRVRTQRPTRGGGRVDLEFEFRDPDSVKVVWVEVKRDAGPSGEDQLPAYARALKSKLDGGAIDSGHLVFLTRPHDWSALFEQFKDGAPEDLWPPYPATWPAVSARMLQWSRKDPDSFEARLVRECVDYLEEEHVASPGLTLEGALVLQRFQETDEAFAALLEMTAERLRDSGARFVSNRQPPQHLNRGRWKDCWWTYCPANQAAWSEEMWLEWNFRLQGPPGLARYCFAAGLTWRGPNNLAPWKDSQIPEKFKRYEDDDFARLYRWLHPEELAACGDLETQADVLHAWVAEAFDALLDQWPPR